MKVILRPLTPPSALIMRKRLPRLADHAIGGRRPLIGHDVADLDLISPAPGSYFFWALRGRGNASRKPRPGSEWPGRTGFGSIPASFPLCLLFFASTLDQVSQAAARAGKHRLYFRYAKRHVTAAFVIDQGDKRFSIWNETHELVRDIPSSAPRDSAWRNGWRRRPWDAPAFTGWARPSPTGRHRRGAPTGSRAARRFISRASGAPGNA